MPKILLTAFEPYEQWRENSSWLTMIELTRWFDSGGKIVTRRYPVDLAEMAHRLGEDLMAGYDFAVHLGQSPGSPVIKLESTGLNMTDKGVRLVEQGPVAYKTSLPLGSWVERLRGEGMPAVQSHHAGTYLCNAALYLSQHLSAERGLSTRSVFVHLPLSPQQVSEHMPVHGAMASMSLPVMAAAVAVLLGEMLSQQTA